MQIGSWEFDFENHKYIMGILNVTPDSFSDGGLLSDVEKAVARALQMKEEGAHIIDIGGESTRPGHTPISEEEEMRRILAVIPAVKEATGLPISVDTYKAKVAEAAILAGADMINDIWGFRKDPDMAKVCAKYQVPCCLMHNRTEAVYEDLMEEIKQDLQISVNLALENGIAPEKILLDPGIGFGKTTEQNLLVLNRLEELQELGYPILLGTSRKSVIGNTLNLPVEEREEGTIATTVMGAMKGCGVFRVHNVRGNERALRMAEAVMGQ